MFGLSIDCSKGTHATSYNPTHTLDDILDSKNGGVSKHLGQIADFMYEWEGLIAEHLELSPADIANIKKKHAGELKLQT